MYSNIRVGDKVFITQLDPKNEPSSYLVKLIKGLDIYIYPESDPTSISSIYYDNSSKKWKVKNSPHSYSIVFESESKYTNYGFTNISDTDKLILAQLDDKDLGNACQSSKYINSLCQSNDFWRIKTKTQLPDTYDYFNTDKTSKNVQGKTWKQHYMDFKDIEITDDELIDNAKNGKLEVVKYLIDKGIDPTADDNYAIIRASKQGHLDVVKYLTSLTDSNGNMLVDPTDDDDFAIILASEHGHLDVVKYLVNLTDSDGNMLVDPTAGNNAAIGLASSNGHLYVVKYLTSLTDEDGNMLVDPTEENNYAIRRASQNGHLEVVKYLTSLTDPDGNMLVDLTADNNYAIRWAIQFCYLELVKYLLDLTDSDGNMLVDPTADDNIAIKYTYSRGCVEVVEELLKIDQVVYLLKKSDDEESKKILKEYKL